MSLVFVLKSNTNNAKIKEKYIKDIKINSPNKENNSYLSQKKNLLSIIKVKNLNLRLLPVVYINL